MFKQLQTVIDFPLGPYGFTIASAAARRESPPPLLLGLFMRLDCPFVRQLIYRSATESGVATTALHSGVAARSFGQPMNSGVPYLGAEWAKGLTAARREAPSQLRLGDPFNSLIKAVVKGIAADTSFNPLIL